MTNKNFYQTPLLKLPNTFRAFYGSFAGLHKIQQQAIDPILNGEDLIVQSATGSGKSEAVLAPVLEKVILSHGKISVLYIIPTRALAIDLKRRFESIIKERLELKLAIRTGDIKNSLTTIPDIMFTTPESLDVMLGSANADVKGFLFRIKIVIIDEVHQLVHNYRGCHLAFLFIRLERRAGCKLQKIAMSATIAHKDQIIDCFGFDKLSQHIIDSVKRKIIARLIHLRNEDSELPALINDLNEIWHYKKILIFANSRGACDRLFSILNKTGAFKDFSQLHYSNLKPLERKEAEKRFRKDSHALCIATSTLELGIDVGDVDAVILYEPPGSVSSFLQRAGRANRRQDKINLWGICRGERAREQVLRFLALLDLSSQGKIETPQSKILPSVLSQQIISCLYEKKQLSAKAMTSLFPEHGNILPVIFLSLEKKRWLSASNIPALFQGGWQYNRHLLEYKIWGNFPEIEEEYILEVFNKPIADIPKSIVGQMDVGNTVFIAGKRLEILKIDHTEQKKVLAKPGEGRVDKQLAWIGMGALVSFEVAKAMEDILKSKTIKNRDCLFKRTKKLLRTLLSLYTRRVVLKNKIEVISTPKASYKYLTFIGAVGNLILEWAVKENCPDDDLYITSDETGLESSLWIKFENLNLPVNHETLQTWVKKHFKILTSIFPLNIFCKTLPRELVIQELTDFFYDQRVLDFFWHCLTHTSDIISGDITDIAAQDEINESCESVPIDIMPGNSLLDMEKEKTTSVKKIKQPGLKRKYTLTGTMISDYFFHGQCEKRFFFKFFKIDSLTLKNEDRDKRELNNDHLRTEIMEKGVRYEAQVLDNLKKQGQNIIFMETDGSIEKRFKAFLKTVKTVTKKLISCSSNIKSPIFLSQPLLRNDLFKNTQFEDDLLKDTCLKHGSFKISPMGIPDLIVLSNTRPSKDKNKDNSKNKSENQNKDKNSPIAIEAGDIKSSLSPQYHQKWQVAFYALLLKNIISIHKLPVKLADTGFILTRNHDHVYKTDRFKLKPYLTAFPMLFKTICSSVSNPGHETTGRLQAHCVSCDLFFHCYQNALDNEDIQFLPELSKGELLKLRQLGWNSISKTYKALEKLLPSFDMNPTDKNLPFSSKLTVKLFGQCRAFYENRIYLNKKKTRLYPENISYRIFIHAIKDPMTGLVSALGWKVTDKNFSKVKSQMYLIDTLQNSKKAWDDFSTQISDIWQAGIQKNRVPHIFYFGSGTRSAVLEWGEYHQKMKPAFLWQTQPNPWTNLQKVFIRSFYLPAPGIVSLSTLAHVFGCTASTANLETSQPETPQPDTKHPETKHPEINQPEISKLEISKPTTLFHHSGMNNIQSTDLELTINSNLAVMDELFKKADYYLESQWRQEQESIEDNNYMELPHYLKFINEEQRLHEESILTMQELTLKERIEQFRAIGYLRFIHTALDEEGRFLHVLKSSRQNISKFRKGDFLKLAPHGIGDLQTGFPVILVECHSKTQEISIRARSNKMHLNRQLLYSLEEDTSQWNQAKLLHVAKFCFSKHIHPLQKFLSGQAIIKQPPQAISWVKHWLATIDHRLNDSQQDALLLPFKYKNSMIQGPPGTGKTHLLGWILIALIMQAKQNNKPLRIGVTALTHQAINNVLEKVISLVNQYMPGNFPCRCIKWGQSEQPKQIYNEKSDKNMAMVEFSNTADEILTPSLVIVGATGYGFYNLFNSRNSDFPRALDWIIFDEASQVQMPQALLSLVYAKGNFLFLGDVNQLSPIVHGNYESLGKIETANINPAKSILQNFHELYPEFLQVTLDISYRMNKEICIFPSTMWYEKKLYPADEIAAARLLLIKPENHISTHLELEYDAILNPAKPSVLVLTDTRGCSTKSETEAQLMAQLAHRLIAVYGIKTEQLALISPHRAQNNAIAEKLEKLLSINDKNPVRLPLIDTIERIQGAQRDIIIFGLTVSDPDHILTDFINNPNRLNVAISRAKTKLIIIGSRAFFQAIPDSENILEKNYCFKALYEHCKKEDSIFEWN